jgi:hypothetical protein
LSHVKFVTPWWVLDGLDQQPSISWSLDIYITNIIYNFFSNLIVGTIVANEDKQNIKKKKNHPYLGNVKLAWNFLFFIEPILVWIRFSLLCCYGKPFEVVLGISFSILKTPRKMPQINMWPCLWSSCHRLIMGGHMMTTHVTPTCHQF